MNAGFTVGTTLERGYCEACNTQLPVGSRCAIWTAGSRQLFCLRCARKARMTSTQRIAAMKYTAVATSLIALYSLAIYLTWREMT